MSSSSFRTDRAIASVRALMTREIGPVRARKLSDRRLHNVVAQIDQSRPRPRKAQDWRIAPASRSQASSSSNSLSVDPVAHIHNDALFLLDFMGMFVFYTHDAPRGAAIILSHSGNIPSRTNFLLRFLFKIHYPGLPYAHYLISCIHPPYQQVGFCNSNR